MDTLLTNDTNYIKKGQQVNIPVFNDVERSDIRSKQETPLNPFRAGGQESIQIGTGFTVFNVDKSGQWMGAPRFSQAPFRVSMEGEVFFERLVNQNGEVISDQLGLNSINVFVKNEVLQTTDQVFVGTSFTPANNLVLTVENLERPTMALAYVSIAGYHSDTDGRLEFRLMVNSVQQGQVFVLNRVAAALTAQTAYMMMPVRLDTGNNTILIEGRSSNLNTGVMNCSVIPAMIGYLLLGK